MMTDPMDHKGGYSGGGRAADARPPAQPSAPTEAAPEPQQYEPCVTGADGRCTRWSHDHEPAPAEPPCNCWRCHERRGEPIQFMIVCSSCGNKRCPHANDHDNACTGSNASGQPGSAYEHGSGAASARRGFPELPGLPPAPAELESRDEGAIKAEALREAADRMPAFHDRNQPEWAITAACRWLRARADTLDGGESR